MNKNILLVLSFISFLAYGDNGVSVISAKVFGKTGEFSVCELYSVSEESLKFNLRNCTNPKVGNEKMNATANLNGMKIEPFRVSFGEGKHRTCHVLGFESPVSHASSGVSIGPGRWSVYCGSKEMTGN